MAEYGSLVTEHDSVIVEYALMVVEHGLVVAEYPLVHDYDANEHVEREYDCAHVVHSTIAIKVQLTDEILSA